MKKLWWGLAALFVLGLSPSAWTQSNFLTVTASNIQRANGSKVANGVISFQATNGSDAPIPFTAGGGGPVVTLAVTAPVMNGAIVGTFQVANPALTSPANIRYRIRIIANGTIIYECKNSVVRDGGGGTFDFDTYVCTSATGIIPVPATGPAGAAGAPGPTVTWQGEWSSMTTYVKTSSQVDAVGKDGCSFISLQDSNTNHSPDCAMDTAYWAIIAKKGDAGAGDVTAAGNNDFTGRNYFRAGQPFWDIACDGTYSHDTPLFQDALDGAGPTLVYNKTTVRLTSNGSSYWCYLDPSAITLPSDHFSDKIILLDGVNLKVKSPGFVFTGLDNGRYIFQGSTSAGTNPSFAYSPFAEIVGDAGNFPVFTFDGASKSGFRNVSIHGGGTGPTVLLKCDSGNLIQNVFTDTHIGSDGTGDPLTIDCTDAGAGFDLQLNNVTLTASSSASASTKHLLNISNFGQITIRGGWWLCDGARYPITVAGTATAVGPLIVNNVNTEACGVAGPTHSAYFDVSGAYGLGQVYIDNFQPADGTSSTTTWLFYNESNSSEGPLHLQNTLWGPGLDYFAGIIDPTGDPGTYQTPSSALDNFSTIGRNNQCASWQNSVPDFSYTKASGLGSGNVACNKAVWMFQGNSQAVYEDFTGEDQDSAACSSFKYCAAGISSAWTPVMGSDSLVIKSNKASSDVSTTNEYAYFSNVGIFPADQCTKGTFSYDENGNVESILSRVASGAATYYRLYSYPASSEIGVIKSVAGTPTTLGTTAVAANSGDVFQFCTVGSTLIPYRNGAAIPALIFSDSDISSSGYPGIHLRWDGTAGMFGYVDDFYAWPAPQNIEIEVPIGALTDDVTMGDNQAQFIIPDRLDGAVLIGVSAHVNTTGTTGTTDFQIARCDAVATGDECSGTVNDMLSTEVTIDSGENKSSTAATPPVINYANSVVSAGQVLRMDIDAVSTTAPKGATLTLTFFKP